MKRFASFIILLFLLSFTDIYNAQEVSHEHSPYYSYIENKGQWPEEVLFQKKLPSGKMWIEEGGILFQQQDYSMVHNTHAIGKQMNAPLLFKERLVEVKFLNSNTVRKQEIVKKGKSNYYFNYFLGDDETKWASDVRGFDEFTLIGIYDGIDLRFIEQESKVKYEFIVAAGSSPDEIQIQYSFHDRMKIDREGNLVVKTDLGEIIEEKPYAYQIVNGKVIEIECQFQLKNDILSFEIGEYNKRVPLVIDPTLVFATYSGSVTDNFGMTATYTSDGSAISGGTIYGNSYPTPDPDAFNTSSNFTVQNVSGSPTTDVFISKYTSDGSQMIWTSFFGGGNNQIGTETVHSLICDAQDNVYFFGATSSVDIPIVNGYQSTHGGGEALLIYYNGVNYDSQGIDIYVAKLSANGHDLLGSTYMGGSGNDGLNYTVTGASMNYNGFAAYDSVTINYGDQFRGEIMLDKEENVVITSSTRSIDFPTMNPIQPNNNGQQDGVVFKLTNDLSNLLFSTYVGGSQNDACYSVKFDSQDYMIIGGATSSTGLPTTSGAWQPSYTGGKSDGMVLKIPPSLNQFSHFSYVGTPNLDHVFFVEIDQDDNVFLLGSSDGGQFPVINASYSNPNSGQFIAKMTSNLSTIERSTVFGNGNGQINISPSAFLVDICGNIYVSGWGANLLQNTPLSGMPVTSDAFQSTPQDGFDFYLSVFKSDLSSQEYGTYMGSMSSREHVDGGTSRFDKNGVVYQSVCGGCGGHSDFPTTPGAWSNTNLSYNCNNIIFKFDFGITPHADFTTSQVSGCAPMEVTFENFSTVNDSYLWNFGNGVTDSETFEPAINYTTPGQYEVILTVTDSECNITDSATVSITVYPELELEPIEDIEICDDEPLTLTANSNGTATTYVWSDNPNFTNPLNNPSNPTVIISTPTDEYYYIKISNSGCELIDSVHVHYNVLPEAQFTPDVLSGCAPLTVNFENNSLGADHFTWDFGNGNTNSSDFESQMTYSNPGTYHVTLSIQDDACNLTDEMQITIVVSPEVELEMPSDIDICFPIPITLTANSYGTATTFIWADNSEFDNPLNNPTDSMVVIQNPEEGYYYMLASNEGCSVMDSVWVHFTSSDIILSGNQQLCVGETASIEAVSTNPNVVFDDFEWSEESVILTGNGTYNVTVQPTETQYIYVTALASNGCVINDSILISVGNLGLYSVTANASDYSVPQGGEVVLTATPSSGFSYHWFPSDGVETPNSSETTATIDEPSIFTVTVTDGVCTKSDTVLITTFPYICNHPYIYVPNAFSPNGDGENDVLYVRSKVVQEILFRVYDRWGEKVFESQYLHNGWDGTFRDKQLNPDVYDYYLKGKCINDEEFLIKGNVTLIR